MHGITRPIVFVGAPPTFVETNDRVAAEVAKNVFAVQWDYVHGNASAGDLAAFRGVQVGARIVETDPDALDEWGRRGEFDLAETYREMFG